NAFSANIAAQEAAAVASVCYEEHFKEQLPARELALYESLDAKYKTFLRDNLGFDFLIYIVKKDAAENTDKSTDIEFFLTLSQAQQEFVKALLPRSVTPCVDAPAATRCLATAVKIEMIKAKD